MSEEEHFLDMEGVSGSIPLPPTIDFKTLAQSRVRSAHEMPMKQDDHSQPMLLRGRIPMRARN
jgi:hypothetical protein